MIFKTLEEIHERIKNPKYRDEIKIARERTRVAMIHTDGVGLQKELSKITGYENDKQAEARQKTAKSMRHVVNNALRGVDKVYSAKGGSREIFIKDARKKEQFQKEIDKTKQHLSVQKWVEDVWQQRSYSDDNGLVYVENDKEYCYPTYKTIYSIYDRETIYQKVEYVIFEPEVLEEGGKIYRVVDDAYDRRVLVKDESISEIKERTFNNFRGFVPAIVASNIPDNVIGIQRSVLFEVIEVLNEMLREDSIRTVFKFKFYFPKLWQYMDFCPTCKGSRFIEPSASDEIEEKRTCPTCNGTGFYINVDVTDVMPVAIPEDGQTEITPPAGWITPPDSFIAESRTERENQELLVNLGIWGTYLDTDNSGTATAKYIDSQAINDRLMKFSKAAQTIEKFIVDRMGEFYMDSMYNGSSITYGTRYLIETADALLEKLAKAKKDNLSTATLSQIYNQYIQAEFANDPLGLELQEKLTDIEPFPYLSVKEVKDLGLTGMSFYTKLCYGMYIEQLTAEEQRGMTKEQGQEGLRKFTEEYAKKNNINLKPQENDEEE